MSTDNNKTSVSKNFIFVDSSRGNLKKSYIKRRTCSKFINKKINFKFFDVVKGTF